MPSDEKEPSTGIDCPDILPLSLQENPRGDRKAMENPSNLVHPDVNGTRRFLMGTKMQMRDSGTSHKRKTCRYHDLKIAKQGSLVKSMNQEALQVTRQEFNLTIIRL